MAGLKPTELDRRIGARIQAARRGAGLTQRAIAAALGVSAAQLQKYEKGTNRIAAASLAPIAEMVGLPITAFFDAPAAPEPEPAPTFAQAQDALVTAALALADARTPTIASSDRAEAA